MGITCNDIADRLANSGALLDKPANTPKDTYNPHYIVLAQWSPHTGAILNLQTYISKEHMNQELRLAQSKFTYIDKWTSNDQINYKLSDQFWINLGTTDAQITQTLKFQYAQYMGSHHKIIF